MPEYFGKDLEAMSFARNYHEWIFFEFRPFLGDAVAEVGAGIGSFSQLLLRAPISQLCAYEPSENMFPWLRQTLSGDSRTRAINGYFGSHVDGRFDSVLYVNVLEHIEDDVGEVAGAYAALNPGGHLLIFVPALPWLYGEVDRQVGHFRRYLKQPLVKLVAAAGFASVKARYFDIAGILPWYVSIVLLKNGLGNAGTHLYDRLVIPPMRRIESLITPPIGKNLLLIARK
jgi:SAM-dependent methyltransferase